MAALRARLFKSRWSQFATVAAGFAMAALWLLTPYLRGVFVRLDSQKRWLIEFGRGSGRRGLDTVKLLQDGTVTLHRHAGQGLEIAELKFNRYDVSRVLEAVGKNRLLGLQKAYHADVRDGTQWVLRIKQGNQEKAMYFDNSFPEEIVAFAGVLDEMLEKNGAKQAEWRRVVYSEVWWHEGELWESIRR